MDLQEVSTKTSTSRELLLSVPLGEAMEGSAKEDDGLSAMKFIGYDPVIKASVEGKLSAMMLKTLLKSTI